MLLLTQFNSELALAYTNVVTCAYVCIKIKHFTSSLAVARPSSDAIKLIKKCTRLYISYYII